MIYGYGRVSTKGQAKVTKNNNLVLTGISIRSREVNLAPTIYMDGYYNDYKNGRPVMEIIAEVESTYDTYKVEQDFDVNSITDFNHVQDKICYKLVNRDKNKELLSDAPYLPFHDLAVIFYVVVSEDRVGTGTVTVHNHLMEMWGNPDIKELYRIAKNNTQRRYKGRVSNMMEIMGEIISHVSEIDAELENYHKLIKKLEKSKSNLEKDIDIIYDDDKHAERKRQDMNNRLNKIYEKIYNIEDMIIDCEKKKEAAKQDILTKENVFKMLLVFDKIFDKMNDADKRKLLESMIAEVHLHPKNTWQEGKNPIKEIKYAFPVSQEVMEALRENVASVETVCLLSKLHEAKHHVNVKLDMDEMDLTAAERR